MWGGIHVEADDRGGRVMGATIGIKAYVQAQKYFQGHSCDADIAGNNGQVNIDDLLLVINGWGPCPHTQPAVPCFGDVQVDNVVNIDDLLKVING